MQKIAAEIWLWIRKEKHEKKLRMKTEVKI